MKDCRATKQHGMARKGMRIAHLEKQAKIFTKSCGARHKAILTNSDDTSQPAIQPTRPTFI